jgi:hypothetical protein
VKKKSAGVKDLPAVITGLYFYCQSGNIRYKVAPKDGFISGMYCRGELRPQEHITAKLMGIHAPELERSKIKALTPLQVHT